MENVHSAMTPPHYIQFDPHGREAFLSQTGTYTPNQRKLFQILCDNWRSEIEYKKFTENHSGIIKNIHSELNTLMQKLQKSHYGLITIKEKANEYEKGAIILTEKASPYFYRYLIQNIYVESSLADYAFLVTPEVLHERGYSIPTSVCEKVNTNSLSKKYLSSISETPFLFQTQKLNGQPVYAPSHLLNFIINICISIIRTILSESNFLAEIARFKNTSLTELKNKIATKAPANWLEITKTVLDYKKVDTYTNTHHISADFFRAAQIVFHFLQTQISEEKQKKAEEKEKENDMKAIIEEMRQKHKEPIPQDEFNSIIERVKPKYEKEFEKFKQDFFDQYVKIKDVSKLPPILFINKQYIHRDNLYSYVKVTTKEISFDLQNKYTQIMAEILKSNNRASYTMFYSKENLDKDIETRITRLEPFLAEIFKKPRVFTEAIIYTAKKEMKMDNLEQIKKILELYFYPGTMKYLPLSEIFDLNIYMIFERSVAKLSLFWQLIIRIIGRYKSFKERYSPYRPSLSYSNTKSDQQTASTFSQNITSEKQTTPSTPMNQTSKKLKEKPSVKDNRSSKKITQEEKKDKKKAKEIKKHYDRKQQEEAWQNFQKTIQKK